MAKIPFDIKYRPQIESGEYKVILDCGVKAEILAWDKPGEYPIVCMAKKEGAIPFRTNSNGIAYHYPEGSNYSDLFIITPELELTDWQKFISGCLQKYGLLDCGAADRIAKECSVELLELATKELAPTFGAKYMNGYENGINYGRAKALKDLPRWRKIGRGSNYSLDTKFIINGRYLEMTDTINDVFEVALSELEKLPKEHETK